MKKTQLIQLIKQCYRQIIKQSGKSRIQNPQPNIYRYTEGKALGQWLMKNKDFFDNNISDCDKLIKFIDQHRDQIENCSDDKIKQFKRVLCDKKDPIKRLTYVYDF